jgi:23S rRNA (cytidine1920-2'-O)/16S rRNA (cytidine1409-2'-O)-methyltransferase
VQILLENGIKEIDCVDVGDNQLHISLRNDSRVNLYEKTDIREFDSSKDYDVISCDVSFISILQIIDAIDNLASSGCDILILYKPQFEVGKEIKRDSKGVVQDIDAITKAKQRFEAKAKELGWVQKANKLSSLKGKEGNQEYMYHFQKL